MRPSVSESSAASADTRRAQQQVRCNRREFVFGTTAAVLAAASTGTAATEEPIEWDNPYKDIRGFNYQPSYEATGYAIWRYFQPDKIDVELGRGKRYFPGINTIRLWLSVDAFVVDPNAFAANFETVLQLLAKYGLKAVPTLFNNWHSVPDFGGISEEMLRRKFVHDGKKGTAPNYVFRPYLERIVGEHAKDERILLWDLCNEPHNNPNIKLTLEWLTHTYKTCKALGAIQPIGVSVQSQLKDVEAISDVFLIHPYGAAGRPLARFVDFAKQRGKGLLATETCIGSLNDRARARTIASDLAALAKHGIGFLPHVLHESLVADCHRPQFGVVHSPGAMHFINMDGSLRHGHDVFNKF
ncbi:MAG: cellulase family glycosylhydrolase [Planctomycetes bacterium]|nr:cellulase family glycosylhydrolase [Planctomycetota bacterium]